MNPYLVPVIGLMLSAVPAGAGIVTYLDAAASNTTLADGTALNLVTTQPTTASPPQDYDVNANGGNATNHWRVRTGLANGSTVFEAISGNSPYTNDCPTLKTTISGLTPGNSYDVFVYYWVADSGAPTGTAQWDIRAGFASNALTNVLWNTGTDVATTTGHFTTSVLTTESNRHLFEYSLGLRQADANGRIAVYVDDYPGNDDRTWYDGVGVSSTLSWIGAGTDANWSTAANWSQNRAPVADEPLKFNGTTRTTPVNDLTAGTSFSGLEFDSTAAAFTLTGNAITLTGDVASRSTANQNIQMGIALSGMRTISTTSTTPTITLSGPLSGTGGLTPASGVKLVLSGTNTYTGGLNTEGSTLTLSNDQSGATGSLLIGPTAATATTVTLSAGALGNVAAANLVRLGNTAGSGTANQTFAISGAMTDDGTLYVGRMGVLNVNNGGTWTQNGTMTLEGIGGYGPILTVNSGGNFVYGGSTPIGLKSSGVNNGGRGLVTVNGGTFTTGQPFDELSANSIVSLLTLQNGGVIKLSADVTAIVSDITFALGTGGGAINTNGFSTSVTAVISGAGGLVKQGAGTLTLAGANTYTGDTTVSGGTLSLSNAVLANASKVNLASAAVLDLTFTGTDTVNQLFIDGVQQAPGTWGSLTSAAAHKSALITGTGLLQVTTGVFADVYSEWAFNKGLTFGVNDGRGDDPDGDGVPNLAEFAFDAAPLSGASGTRATTRIATAGGAPALVITLPVRTGVQFGVAGNDMLSVAKDGLVYQVQASLDLASWSTVSVLELNTGEETPIHNALPALDAGWSYRSFYVPGSDPAATPRCFLRAKASESP